MTKLYGWPVVLAACGYPALPAVGGQDAAPEADAPEADAPVDASTGSELPPPPKVDVSIGGPVTTELMTSNTIPVVVRASNGFSGNVALAISAVDPTDVVIPQWTVSLAATTLNVPLDDIAQTTATLVLPPKKAKLAGKVKVTVTAAGTDGNHTASATITVTDQVTWPLRVDAVTTACVYPANGGTTAAPVTIALGTKVRFFNNGTAGWQLHATGLINHQVDMTAANTAYEQTPSGVGTVTWYCHSPGPDIGANDPTFKVE